MEDKKLFQEPVTPQLPSESPALPSHSPESILNHSASQHITDIDLLQHPLCAGDADLQISPSHDAFTLVDFDQTPADDRRGRHWLAFLVLPGRLAFAAASFLAGATIGKRVGAARVGSLTCSFVAFAFGQILLLTAQTKAYTLYEAEMERAERVHNQRIAWFEAVQAVGKILQTFQEDLPPTLPPSRVRHLYMDISFLRMLHEKKSQKQTFFARKRTHSCPNQLALGRDYLDYAVATYGYVLLKLCGILDPRYNARTHGSRGIDVVKYLLRLPDEHLIACRLDGESLHVPRHFVALDEKREAIVIAIRGTNSISDIITDLLCLNAPFADGYAHGGMKDAAEALYTSLLPTLRNARTRFPRYSIVVTGHSLGAGVALLLTKVLLMRGFSDVKCYAIAPCPVFGPMHKVDSDWSDAVECFVHGDDIVARLCFKSARKLVHQVDHIRSLPITVQERKGIINSNDIDALRELLVNHKYHLDVDTNETPLLHIPTHRGIHWLLPKEERGGKEAKMKKNKRRRELEHASAPAAYVSVEDYDSYIAKSKLFESMLVTSECISCHFPGSYIAAFASLDIPARDVRASVPRLTDYTRAWYSNELG